MGAYASVTSEPAYASTVLERGRGDGGYLRRKDGTLSFNFSRSKICTCVAILMRADAGSLVTRAYASTGGPHFFLGV